jgi:MFS transporter, FHS family, Na+ dependent glucose transporter 1
MSEIHGMNIPITHRPELKSLISIVYYLSFIVLGLLTAAEGPALPSLADNTSSSLDQISLIFVFGALGYLLGSLAGGQAYDRMPGHRLLAITLVAISLCASLVPIMVDLKFLLLVLFIMGTAKGALDVGCNTLLLWLHGDKAGPYMNSLHFFFGLGATLAPLFLARVLLVTGGIQWAFWLFALLSLPLAIWLWVLPEPLSENTTFDPENSRTLFAPVALVILALMLYVGAEIGFGSWIYTYALTLGLGTTLTAAYLTSAFWGTFTFGRLLGVWVSTRIRIALVLFLDLAGCLACLGVILLWQKSVMALWLGTIGLGLFMASIFPTTLMLARERMHITGSMTGWFLAGASVGGMSLPWGIGQAFVLMGAETMPLVILVAVILIMLVYWLFLTRPLIPLRTE